MAALRNRLIHKDEEAEFSVEPGDIFYLSAATYVLVLLVLLAACEVDPVTLDTASENRRIVFLSGLIPEIVTRLIPELYPHRVSKDSSPPDV